MEQEFNDTHQSIGISTKTEFQNKMMNIMSEVQPEPQGLLKENNRDFSEQMQSQSQVFDDEFEEINLEESDYLFNKIKNASDRDIGSKTDRSKKISSQRESHNGKGDLIKRKIESMIFENDLGNVETSQKPDRNQALSVIPEKNMNAKKLSEEME